VAAYAGLTSLPLAGTQNLCNVFDMTLGHSDSYLLYRAETNYTPDRGIGVVRMPAGGGTNRLNGARFAFVSGRPYRWNHTSLRTNVMWILENLFLEPVDQSAVGEEKEAPVFHVGLPSPNPSHGAIGLSFTLPAPRGVALSVHDVSGRLVRRVFEGSLTGGDHRLEWDGTDLTGRPAPAGAYGSRLDAGGVERTARVTLLR
jgi:hypothetical protein